VSENTVEIAAPRTRVFEVLADPDAYAEWVVGADRIRAADDGWPAPTNRVYHSTGAGPVHVDDSTEVVECEPPERLVLLARLGPLGTFRVELVLAERGDATEVTMWEKPVDGISRFAGPVGDAVGTLRNSLSLRKLTRRWIASTPPTT